MNPRFTLYRRGQVFYCQDTETGEQSSLRTRDKYEAQTLLLAQNEALRQPVPNRQIARAFLTACDPLIAQRTWQDVMNEIPKLKTGNTRARGDMATRISLRAPCGAGLITHKVLWQRLLPRCKLQQSHMTPDDFVRIVRAGADKLRVDDIVVASPEHQFRGKGMLRVTQSRLDLDVTFEPGTELPELKDHILTKRDGWKLSGIIDDDLKFRCPHVWPPANRSWSGPSGIKKCCFHLHPIELIPEGWDALTPKQRDELRRQLLTPSIDPQTDQPACFSDEPGFRFVATLREYPLPFLLSTEAQKGEVANYTYEFQKDEESRDLNVTISSKENCPSSREDDDWSVFQAFMTALAFTSGVHAWPFRTAYWRAGTKVLEQVTAADTLRKTAHSPFSEALDANARTGNLVFDFQSAFNKLVLFFQSDSPLSKEVAQVLFLFREADTGMNPEITTIALCVLFENLVRRIFDHQLMPRGTVSEALAQFKAAKEDIASYAQRRLAEDQGDPYQRLVNIVQSAQAFTVEQMFREIVHHFGLKWEADMKTVFATWKTARNELVHDKKRTWQSEDDLKAEVLTESRIAGAINTLVLKLAGYSGWARTSSFEDRYRPV